MFALAVRGWGGGGGGGGASIAVRLGASVKRIFISLDTLSAAHRNVPQAGLGDVFIYAGLVEQGNHALFMVWPHDNLDIMQVDQDIPAQSIQEIHTKTVLHIHQFGRHGVVMRRRGQVFDKRNGCVWVREGWMREELLRRLYL